MSRDYAKALMEDHLDDAYERAKAGLSFSPMASLAGSISSSLLSPVDVASGYGIPVASAARWGLGATVASRAGTGLGRFASRTVNGAINGTIGSVASQLPMAALYSANQKEYTVQDALSNIAIGPVMGGAFGALHGASAHLFGDWDRAFANAVQHASVTDKDPSVAASILASDPRAQAVADVRAKVKEILSKNDRSQDETDILAMAADAPDDILKARTSESRSRTRKVIDEVLANPEDKRIRSAITDDEKFLAEAWKTLWGVELKYVDKQFARNMGFRGFTRPSDPTRAYISEGALNDGSVDSMMFVAGHELGHSVRLRDPKVWNDMVSAMMKTAEMDNGALADSWRTVVRHNRGNGVWAGLDFAGKMDETYATVLGRAMQSQHFWQALHRDAPASAGTLSKFLFGVRTKLSSLLHSRITPSTRSLYEGLSQSLMASGIDEKTVTVREALDLAALYSKHRPGFRKLTQLMAEELNRNGLEIEDDMAKFVAWHNDAFPEVAELEDRSATPAQPGRFATILRGRRINSNNPGLWLLTNVFAKAKEGTPEHDIAKKFAERALVWDHTKDKRTASGSKDFVSTALRLGPLAAFKKNEDGTWDIGIFRNDDFPKWHEVLSDDVSDIDMVARAFVEEELDAIRTAFGKFVSGEQGSPSREFDEFIGTLGQRELDELVANDLAALWQAYAEFLEEKMVDYRLLNDPKSIENLSELRRAIDPLLSPEKEKTEGAADPKELQAAWNKFRKAYPELKEKLTDRALERNPLDAQPGPETPEEFFKNLFKEVREEIVNEVSEVRQMLDRLRHARDGKLGLMDDKGRSFFSRDSAKLDDRMNAAIDQMAHQRIVDSGKWPQYGRWAKIAEAVTKGDDPKFVPLDERFDIADPFADLSDEFSFMASTPEDVTKVAERRRLSVEEANKLARTRLDRDHAEWSPFFADFESSAESFIKSKSQGFTLDPEPKASPEAEAAKPKDPYSEALDLVKRNFTVEKAVLDSLTSGGTVPKGTPDFVIDDVQFTIDYHARQGLSRDAVIAATEKDLRRKALAKAIQEIHSHEASRNLAARAKAGLDTLYSYLDGIARKDVKAAGASVAENISARVQADVTPFVNDLIATGLDTQWRNGDETIVRAIISEMKGVGSGEPVIQRLAETLKKTQEAQVGRLNARGANIRVLDGYVFSQVHSPHAIRSAGPEFLSDLGAWVDWEATERSVGPNTPEGKFDRGLYLKQLQHELSKTERTAPEGFDPVTMGGNLANRTSHRRTIHFKDTYAFDYDTKYGSGNTAGMIFEQLVKRAELATVMESFGPDYKKTWNKLMYDLGRAGQWRYSKLGRIDLTFQGIVGDLNHPEDIRLAAAGQATRQYMNSVALWMSGISSISDVGNAASTMSWMGVPMGELHGKFFSAMKENGLKTPEQRQFLIAQGAGLSALLSAFSRTQVLSSPVYRMAEKASDFTFKYNGQEIWTRTVQSAFHDVTTQHLGEMAGSKALSPEFSNWLSHYGITESEWRTMAKHATEIDGLEGPRLAPDLIPEAALAQKLRTAISDSMHQAVLEPTVSDKALLTLGTKAGTKYGETVRLVMQYKSYPLAMVRRVQRRFQNAYGNDQLMAFGGAINKGQLDWLVWSGSMLSLAALAVSIKDLLRGREPMNPFDKDQWTMGNATRIVAHAGVGPFGAMEQFLSPHQALGPALGGAYSLASGVASGSGYKTTNAAMGLLPGSSLAPVKESSKAVLGSIFAESYGVAYQTFLRRHEQETGQSSIFLDSSQKP